MYIQRDPGSKDSRCVTTLVGMCQMTTEKTCKETNTKLPCNTHVLPCTQALPVALCTAYKCDHAWEDKVRGKPGRRKETGNETLRRRWASMLRGLCVVRTIDQ